MIQKPKGTIDIYDKNGKIWIHLNNIINDICSKYNYNFIKTPMFEDRDLFHRGIGETTDIVSKETYDFEDKSSRPLTLKPEGTAGAIRSFIENKMYTNITTVTKLYYVSPCFRYERPQAGRLREHTQFGVEVLGSMDPLVDAEVINIAVTFFKRLNFTNIKVKINTIGDSLSRNAYKEALVKYFEPNVDKLCPDCKSRLHKNPLRILDCKVDCENEVLTKAPKIYEYLNEQSNEHFSLVKKYLDGLNIQYVIDDKLVRGLDYYSHTVFEIQADIPGFGSQNTLCGGGRYNNLVETLGGPNVPGIGFGMGLERIILALEENLKLDNTIDLFIINLSDNKNFVFNLANKLRSNYKVDIDYLNKNLKGQFKQVDKLESKYLVIIGDDEIKNNKCIIKNNITKEETNISIDEIENYLKRM